MRRNMVLRHLPGSAQPGLTAISAFLAFKQLTRRVSGPII
jgi:hypothetical protein